MYAVFAAFWIATLSACAAYLCGIDYFVLPVMPLPKGTLPTYVVAFILFMCNMFFVLGFSLKIHGKCLAVMLLCYAPVWALCQVIDAGSLAGGTVVPLLYCVVVNLIKHRDIRKAALTALRYLELFVVSAFYQIVSMLFKFQISPSFFIGEVSLTAQVIYSVDNLLFLGLIYLMSRKGDKPNAKLELDFCAEHIGNDKAGSKAYENQESIAWYKALPRRDKAKMIAALAGIQAAQLVAVAAVCFIGNVVLELAIILPMFWVARRLLGKSWHAQSVSVCTSISMLLFYAGCKMSIPVRYSLFMPVIVGVVLAYVMYAAAYYTQNYAYMKAQTTEKVFNCKTATAEEICARARQRGVKPENAQLIIEKYVYGKSHKELCRLEESEKACQARIRRIVRKING